MRGLDRLGWAVTVPLRAGQYVLGVRTNSEAFAEVLREVLADRLVPHADPPANLSVHIASKTPADAAQDLHLIYEGHRVLRRTRTVSQLLDGLGRRLTGWDARACQDTLVLDAVVLHLDGRAHLLAADSRQRATRRARKFADAGLMALGDRWFVLDPAAGTLTLPSAQLAHSARLRGLLAELDEDDADVGEVPAGTWPIASWTAGDERLSMASRVVLAGGQVLDRTDHSGAELVTGLAALLDAVPTLPHDWARHEELPSLLAELSSAPPGTSP